MCLKRYVRGECLWIMSDLFHNDSKHRQFLNLLPVADNKKLSLAIK